MLKNKITIISRNEEENADVEKQSKQFAFMNNQIHCSNRFQIRHNQVPTCQELNVFNQLCQTKNNTLTKTTVVQFEDKLITIEDSFYLDSSEKSVKVEGALNGSGVIAEPRLVGQPHSNSLQNLTETHSKKKDLKNIVKNIVKIFINWLETYDKGEMCLQQIHLLLEHNKYNNSLIKQISKNQQLNTAFLKFSRREGEQMIENSRIHDKKTHIQALKKYKKTFISDSKSKGQSTASGSAGNSGNSGSNSSNKGMSNEGSESNQKEENFIEAPYDDEEPNNSEQKDTQALLKGRDKHSLNQTPEHGKKVHKFPQNNFSSKRDKQSPYKQPGKSDYAYREKGKFKEDDALNKCSDSSEKNERSGPNQGDKSSRENQSEEREFKSSSNGSNNIYFSSSGPEI